MSETIHSLRGVNLVKRYKGAQILHGVSIEVKSAQTVGLLGPNGAGKTTTFYIICGLVEATSGEVWLNDAEIGSLRLFERARAGISYLPQEASIFKDLTVEENLLMAAELACSNDKPEQHRRVETLLEQFGIEHIRARKGINLSGGERRRAEIARALVSEPKFILLDEPFAGVDPIAVADIQKTIVTLTRQNIGVLITDHNVRETLSICDRAYVLHEGMIMASGSAEAIGADRKVRAHYLGESFRL
ncbi:MAG: LPS export ABC transporter ATP-binding protein [Helicobacteraceae bacterium]|jgi:lipopolysaccharide export system ATP-binding protein|nr:LPS export ABC transporter ATP-binding protein [Helicobacteraceae bacterium]